jgi:hypothetical protein
MKTLIRTSKALFIGLFFTNLIIAFFTPFILPEKYFNDTATIIFDKNHEIGWIGSYPFAILFYKITGLRHLPFFIIALIQFPIITFILYTIYMSMPTKEFITFLMFSPIPFVFMSKKTTRFRILFSLILFICFSFFRSYYMLVPIFAVGLYLLTFLKFQNKTFSIIFYGLIIAVFLSLCHGIIKGDFLSQLSRENYYLGAGKNYEVNSAIQSPFPQSTWYGEAFGIFYGYIAVNIPLIEGAKRILSPQILVFVIWELILFYLLLTRFSRCLRRREHSKIELWILLILFAYFMVQGIFEPDLGSSIRHKIGFLPLIYFALYYEHFRKDIQQII